MREIICVSFLVSFSCNSRLIHLANFKRARITNVHRKTTKEIVAPFFSINIALGKFQESNTKVLAKRLEKVLPYLIHPNQNAFVKGRSIFDAIRTIDDIVDDTKRNSWSGIMIAIDFEKAFDTLDFQFLIRTLHKFNFGPSFIHWIRVLYKNASSCVMNNGFTTGPFLLGRGVRQGDPLSPYLFILALETLAIKIREDCNVQGLKIGEEMIKLSLFADDMTCVIKDKTSYTNLFRILNSFGECFGLKVNVVRR